MAEINYQTKWDTKMSNTERRRKLITATVKVIGKRGIENATTKAISEEAGGINEAYIYRIFENKEDLYKTAFSSVTKKFHNKILILAPLLNNPNISNDDRWWLFVSGIWKYVVNNQETCMCYLRYYYSACFKVLSYEEHNGSCQNIIKTITPTFKNNANSEMLFNYIIDTILSFAVKTFNSDNKNDTKPAQQVYELIYFAVKPYLTENTSTSIVSFKEKIS